LKTIYESLGKENLSQLVDNFYDLVEENPKISPLFKIDFEEIKEKQLLFLTQFFGGPQLYNQKFGHPRMRMRHIAHKIDEEAKDEWLDCMAKAIDKLSIDISLKKTIFMSFPQIAQHMVNS